MGRAESGNGALPRGITIRQLRSEQRVQIAFSYKGQQCREMLPSAKITKTYIEYAAGLRAEIRRKIADDVFNYAAYFPDSPKAKEFAPPKRWLSLADLLSRQLGLYEKQVENGTLSASTLLGYAKAINHRLIPKWGQTSVADLSPVMLREWISGLGVTGKTVRNILTPLRAVLDDAVNDDLIKFNPLDRVALKRLIKQTAKKSDYEVDPFDMDEVAQLLKSCRLDERPMIQFWFESGLRPGEMIGLSWSSIDFAGKVAFIRDNVVTGLVEGEITSVEKAPKTGAGVRLLELSERALEALEAQKPLTFEGSGRVWMNPRTAGPWSSESQIRKTLWEPLCTRAAVRYRNPYQARHTFASTLLTAGCNPFWLADQMGHVDAEMVFKIYGKWIPLNYQRGAKFTRVSHTATETAGLNPVTS